MTGIRQKCDGDMWDYFSPGRRLIKRKPGLGKEIKQRANQRLRQKQKKELKDEE